MKQYLSMFLLCSITSLATTLTPEQALCRINGQRLGKVPVSSENTIRLCHTIEAGDGMDALYIFNRTDGNGYIVAAADDVAPPVLGYCDSGSFNGDEIPPQLEAWLAQYSRQIEYARKNSLHQYDGSQTWDDDWTSIGPLVKSKWNQDSPYNDLCPEVDARKSYTGCVATAMSQVMNYWKYPESGHGVVKYRPMFVGKELELDLSQLTFDWNNMLDEYDSGNYTRQQADAVATLMMASGYTVFMDYSPQSSGAQSIYIRKSLVENFKYDECAEYVERAYYSSSDWTRIIYESLRDYGPVIYDGMGSVGGHSFVCDGYDTDGFFHINWGWGGNSDGYFRLEAMNPEYIGIGGFDGGFNFTQDAIINIRIPEGEHPGREKEDLRMSQYGSLTAFVDKGRLRFGVRDYSPLGWLNNNPETFNFSMGFKFKPLDNENGDSFILESVNMLNKKMDAGTYIPYMSDGKIKYSPYLTINKLDIPDGRYRVTLMTLDLGKDNAEWLSVKAPYGMYDSVLIDKHGEEIDITNLNPTSATVTAISTPYDFYHQCPSYVNCRFVNESEIQTTQCVSFVLLDEKDDVAYSSNGIFLILDSGESMDCKWESVLKDRIILNPEEDCRYTLAVYDSSYDRILYRGDAATAVMHPYPGIAEAYASITCPDADKDIVDGKDTFIHTGGDLFIDCDIEVTKGVFSSPLYMHVLRIGTSGTESMVTLEQNPFIFLKSGEKETYRFSIDTENMDKDEIYTLQASYNDMNGDIWLDGTAYFMCRRSDAVESVNKENVRIVHEAGTNIIYLYGDLADDNPHIYGVDGHEWPVKTEKTEKYVKLCLENMGSGFAILVYKDAEGKLRTAKLTI